MGFFPNTGSSGSGGGGTGTTGKITKFTDGAAGTIGDSVITESSGNVSLSGSVTAGSFSGSGASLTNIPTPTSAIWKRIATYSPSSASSQSITLPDTGAEYEVYFNLAQETTAGVLGFRANADSGSTYTWNSFLIDDGGNTHTGSGAPGSSITLLGNTITKVNATSRVWGSMKIRTQPGNTSNLDVWNVSSFCDGTKYNNVNVNATVSYCAGYYAGSGAITACSILTDAGTFSGSIELWEKLP